MRPIPLLRPLSLMAAVLLATASPMTQAQYQWREGGRMVYSDRPPPASVPAANIVRYAVPLQVLRGSIDGPARAPSQDSDAPEGRGPRETRAGGADGGEPDARQKKAEAEKKAAEDAARKADLDKACTMSRNQLKGLEAGVRATRFNANGELEYIEDDERAARITDLRRNIEGNCNN